MVSRIVLTTGAGGIGGINFVRALRLAEKQTREHYKIIGTDFNIYRIHFADLDARYRTPRHSDPEFIPTLINICRKHNIQFLHPHPSVEARVVAEKIHLIHSIGVKTYLPSPHAIMPDKLYIHNMLEKHDVPTPKTVHIQSMEDVDKAFELLGKPLWIRVTKGAGGRLSLKVNTPEEAKLWINLNVIQGRAVIDDFILQEYLPGRDIAYDSLWYKGKLITSYARERLEYPFKHITLTGLTGTPTLARIIVDENVNRVGASAVKALDPEPHGFYSVDIKEDAEGKPVVTEVDGKWHTTAPLWGYAIAKVRGDPDANLAYLYIKLGYGEEPPNLPQYDLFPENYYLVRQLDSGVLLFGEGSVWRIV